MTAHCNTHAIPVHHVGSKGLFARLSLAHAAWRQRRALARLDNAALNDIGISRAEAQNESARPVWDVPSHWLR